MPDVRPRLLLAMAWVMAALLYYGKRVSKVSENDLCCKLTHPSSFRESRICFMPWNNSWVIFGFEAIESAMLLYSTVLRVESICVMRNLTGEVSLADGVVLAGGADTDDSFAGEPRGLLVAMTLSMTQYISYRGS